MKIDQEKYWVCTICDTSYTFTPNYKNTIFKETNTSYYLRTIRVNSCKGFFFFVFNWSVFYSRRLIYDTMIIKTHTRIYCCLRAHTHALLLRDVWFIIVIFWPHPRSPCCWRNKQSLSIISRAHDKINLSTTHDAHDTSYVHTAYTYIILITRA